LIVLKIISNKCLGDQSNYLGQKVKQGVGFVMEEVQNFENFGFLWEKVVAS
jgi:hypothetical protein